MGSNKKFLDQWVKFLTVAAAFSFGVILSVLSPSWMAVTTSTIETHVGPLFAKTRTCEGSSCSNWYITSMQSTSCSGFETLELDITALCTKVVSWRLLSISSLFFVITTDAIIFVTIISSHPLYLYVMASASIGFLATIGAFISTISSVVSFRELVPIETAIAGFSHGFWIFVVSGAVLGCACICIFYLWSSEANGKDGLSKKDDDEKVSSETNDSSIELKDDNLIHPPKLGTLNKSLIRSYYAYKEDFSEEDESEDGELI